MAMEQEGFRTNGGGKINISSITDYKLDQFKQLSAVLLYMTIYCIVSNAKLKELGMERSMKPGTGFGGYQQVKREFLWENWAFGQELQVRHSMDCRDVYEVRNGKGHGTELRRWEATEDISVRSWLGLRGQMAEELGLREEEPLRADSVPFHSDVVT